MGITVIENDRAIEIKEDELESKYRSPLGGDMRWRSPRNVWTLAVGWNKILKVDTTSV